MAREDASFLTSSISNDDFDVELDDVVENDRGCRFGLFPRLAVAGACACVLGWVNGTIARSARHPEEKRSNPFLQAIQLDAMPSPKISARSLLKPLESMHDGNVCDAEEELYGGLCYKQCSLLTQGEAPIRTSSWTCCESHPCSFSNQRGSIGHTLLCEGFDVNAEGGCPNKPGACLLDEELHLGICYKKCSLLTDGIFPYRVAAATCCKTQGLGCMDIFNDKTSDNFDVGGGNGDQSQVHPPDEHLTEEGEVVITTTTVVTSTNPLLQNVHFEPMEHLHDGNVCDDEEELYGGVCYKKCALLTSGVAPIRTSSWTCCEGHPCGLWNQKGSVGLTVICNGYDVSADGSCPHKPGACLVNEEMLMGVCYQKCSMLTNLAFPYRLTAATCCKEQGIGCLNPRNDMTSDAFDVGGGRSDDDDAQAHLPDESLTEVESQTPDEAATSKRDDRQSKLVEVGKELEDTNRAALAKGSTDAHGGAMLRRAMPAEGASGAASIAPLQDPQNDLQLGSALPFKPREEALDAQRAREDEQVREAREAQAAVAAVIRAMK